MGLRTNLWLQKEKEELDDLATELELIVDEDEKIQYEIPHQSHRYT